MLAPDLVSDIVAGLERRGIFADCDAVLSGYIGDDATGGLILDTVTRVRAANPRAVYCCDPVMGDRDERGAGAYVSAEIVAHMAQRAVPAADIVTPNLYELAVLAGLDPQRVHKVPLAALVEAARRLLAPGRPTHTVLLTSLQHLGMAADKTGAAVITRDGAWLVTTPHLSFAGPPHGCGDCPAALFCAALLDKGDPADALGEAMSALFAILDETSRRGEAELALIAAQSAFVAPKTRFIAETIGQVA